jgi:hypothetical protein
VDHFVPSMSARGAELGIAFNFEGNVGTKKREERV